MKSIRKQVPSDFILGIKLNAADYIDSGYNVFDARQHLISIASWECIDFIELSGGDYESPGKPILFFQSFCTYFVLLQNS